MFSHRFVHIREKAAKRLEWGKPGKLVPILFPKHQRFLPLDCHPVVYFIIREMHGFPRQFLIARENPTKPIVSGRTWEISFFFHSTGTFLPSDCHPMIYFKSMAFPINLQ